MDRVSCYSFSCGDIASGSRDRVDQQAASSCTIKDGKFVYNNVPGEDDDGRHEPSIIASTIETRPIESSFDLMGITDPLAKAKARLAIVAARKAKEEAARNTAAQKEEMAAAVEGDGDVESQNPRDSSTTGDSMATAIATSVSECDEEEQTRLGPDKSKELL